MGNFSDDVVHQQEEDDGEDIDLLWNLMDDDVHQHEEEGEEEDASTLSQRFHPNKSNPSSSPKKLGTKKTGHNLKSLSELVDPEKPTSTKRCKRKWPEENKFDDYFDLQTSTMERAAEVQSKLDPQFPSFYKLMLRSHVTHGFWLSLPMGFCHSHLPKSDLIIILEGEDGVEYRANFLSGKVGLSGGWRGFSLMHKLLEGDVVVFQLVLPCKFKVYIVRANRLTEVDGALNLMHLDDSASETDFACNKKDMRICQQTDQSHQMPLSQGIHHETPAVENATMTVYSSPAPVTDESANGRQVVISVSSEDMDDIGLSNLSNSFVEFRDFQIIVNGSTIDSELSKYLQAKYYDLCCARNSYLHDRLLKSISKTLAAEIISETMNIADAIRTSNLSTSLEDYEGWDKVLEAFELLGMDVGFLRARLNRLVGLVVGSTEEVDSERYGKACCERNEVKEEVRNLEVRLLELKEACSRLEKEMECLKENAERYEIMFQQEATAPW